MDEERGIMSERQELGNLQPTVGNKTKWLVLSLSAFTLFASYYSLDNPAALHDPMKSYFNDPGFEYYFGLMYSLYSVSNIFLPFFGGILIDRFQAANMNLIFCILLLIGQIFVTIGVWSKSFIIVLIGRTIFGAGAESLCVGVSALLAIWFLGGNVALAMGLSLSISRLGSVINNVLSPALAKVGMPYAFLFSSILLGLGICAGLVVIRLDRIRRQLAVEDGASSTAKSASPSILTSLKRFPWSFWVLCVSCVSVYGVVIPFNSFSSAFLIDRDCGGACCPGGDNTSCDAGRDAQTTASFLMGIPYIISGVSVPVLAFFVDRFGQRASLTLFSAFCLFVVHLIFAVSAVPPAGPLVLQGIAYAIYAAALWPSVALIVHSEDVGFAYGLITAIQNAGLTVVPLGVAAIRDKYGSYSSVELLFMSLALLGVLAGILLNILDCRSGHILNLTTTKATESETVARVKQLDHDLVDDVTSSVERLVAQRQADEHSESEPLLVDDTKKEI